MQCVGLMCSHGHSPRDRTIVVFWCWCALGLRSSYLVSSVWFSIVGGGAPVWQSSALCHAWAGSASCIIPLGVFILVVVPWLAVAFGSVGMTWFFAASWSELYASVGDQ